LYVDRRGNRDGDDEPIESYGNNPPPCSDLAQLRDLFAEHAIF